METPVWEVSMLLADNNMLTEEQFSQLLLDVRKGEYERKQFSDMLNDAENQQRPALEKDAALAMKMAQGYYALGQYDKARQWLDKAGNGKDQTYLKAIVFQALSMFDDAISEYEQAQEKGADPFDIAMHIVDCLRDAGRFEPARFEQAQEKLDKLARVGEIRAEYHYQLGKLKDALGEHEAAMEQYEQAVKLDEGHLQAWFCLGYVCDLYGDEQRAVECYTKCASHNPCHISALLNLAVLYEDAGEYDNAQRCVKQVLQAYPNHRRARMFEKDITSSMSMYYDEEKEKIVDMHNQILKIPISDFELSVRSRNCLRKMNIKCLGDLMKVTESELLAYKNFGETSLQEVKAILAQKNLRLGQLLEERTNKSEKAVSSDQQEGSSEELQASVLDLKLSIRAMKCLDKLNIQTIGELVNCTEAELLGCKNFGQTSLEEIKERLAERNLSLRQIM